MPRFVKTNHQDAGFGTITTRVTFDEALIRHKFGWNPDVNPQDAYDLDRYFAVSYGMAMKPGPWTVEEN